MDLEEKLAYFGLKSHQNEVKTPQKQGQLKSGNRIILIRVVKKDVVTHSLQFVTILYKQ